MYHLQVNNFTMEFTNCDTNPSSYMALFPKQPSSSTSTSSIYYSNFNNVVNSLFTATTQIIPDEYYMFLESGFGGCGWYVQSSPRDATIPQVSGAAIGFRWLAQRIIQQKKLSADFSRCNSAAAWLFTVLTVEHYTLLWYRVWIEDAH